MVIDFVAASGFTLDVRWSSRVALILTGILLKSNDLVVQGLHNLLHSVSEHIKFLIFMA